MVMKTYRKKSVVVFAVVWTGHNISEVIEDIGKENIYHTKKNGLEVKSKYGLQKVEVGDYLVKDFRGEVCRVSKEEFFKDYWKI